MQRLVKADLPNGFGFDWAGQSLQEIVSAAQAPALFALSILVVYLALAALYESWSIPVAVLFVVPVGLIAVRWRRSPAGCRTTSTSRWVSSPSSDLPPRTRS